MTNKFFIDAVCRLDYVKQEPQCSTLLGMCIVYISSYKVSSVQMIWQAGKNINHRNLQVQSQDMKMLNFLDHP
tara:strand:+ start:1486 stop:1704 length:219 start_codon:yes stop_codon:yes gene_type:complete